MESQGAQQGNTGDSSKAPTQHAPTDEATARKHFRERFRPEAALRSMDDHWREFRDLCYPEGTGAEQNKQLHRAFFAGAICLKEELQKISTLQGDLNPVALANLYQEILAVGQAHATNPQKRN